MKIYKKGYDSPIGSLTIFFYRKRVCGLVLEESSFLNQIKKLQGEIEIYQKRGGEEVVGELDKYFKKTKTVFRNTETCFLTGSKFERMVWETTRKIEYGEVKTYKWVAERIGKPKAYRAVGNALNKNPILIIIPCHRVIKSNGEVGGFGSGIEIKKELLKLEGVRIKEGRVLF